VLTDPVTSTQITTLSELALNSDFAATDTVSPATPRQEKLRVLGSATDEIVLVWEPSADNVAVTGYQIIRDGSMLDTTPYPVYIDSGLQPNQTYSYEIVAIDGAGNASEPTASVSATGITVDALPTPSAPKLLTQRSASRSKIELLWVQDDIANVAGFNVYRSVGDQPASNPVRVTSTLLTDVNVQENTTYCYQVAGGGMDPLAEWVLPDIEALDCTQQIRSDSIQTGITLITEQCLQVPEDLIIGAGATLRVAAGVVLIFGDGARLVVPRDATLTVDATPQSPVVLTGEVALPGYWGGVEFQQSTSPGNLLRGAVVQYAGGSETNRFQGISFNLSGTIIDSFQGNRITENERVGIVSLNLLPTLDGNSEFTGNTLDKIDVPRSQYDRPMRMPNLGVTLDWTGVSIMRASLTIDPGVELIVVGGSEIRVDGALSVNGTENEPISLRAKSPELGPGNWSGFLLSGRGDKTFNHVDISHAGAAGETNGAIKVDCRQGVNAKLQIDNADITDSASWAIFIEGEDCDTVLGDNITYFNNALGNVNAP